MVDEEKIVLLGQSVERTISFSKQVAHLNMETGVLRAQGNRKISCCGIMPLSKGGGEDEDWVFEGGRDQGCKNMFSPNLSG